MEAIARHAACGESFPLAEVVQAGDAGRCPRCGAVIAPGYAAPLVLAARRYIEAVATLDVARGQLSVLAPELTITEDAAAPTSPAPDAGGASRPTS